jgi:purine nucleosidase
MRQHTCAPVAVLLAHVVGSLLPTQCQAREPGSRAPIAEPGPASPLAVVLATDCGVEVDDQWALAHLLLSREVDLRAIVTTHASSIGFSSATSAKEAAEVIARVLPAGSHSPPVVAGSDSPLKKVTAPRENPGVDLLLELSRSFSASRRLAILSIGAGTDVASAILKDPSLVNRVSVVAMGFDGWPGGGDGFNVKNDPLAWQIILDSDVPVVVGSGAATRRGLRLTRAEARALMQAHGAVGEYLYAILDGWLTKQAPLVAQFVAPDTWVMWDEVVVAYALGMARGTQVPRPQLRPDLSFSHPETSRRITWVTEIETDRFWRDLTEKIDARQRPTRQP